MHDDERLATAKNHLTHGPLHPFREVLDPDLPNVAAGCYTVWHDDGRFVYAGMAGRGLSAEGIVEARGVPRRRMLGLKDRLDSHKNGRRSGDQFAVYVFDRFVLPLLTTDQIAEAAKGRRRLDEATRRYIHSHLSYRWWETNDSQEAYELEKVLVTEGLDGALPLFNPKKVEEG